MVNRRVRLGACALIVLCWALVGYWIVTDDSSDRVFARVALVSLVVGTGAAVQRVSWMQKAGYALVLWIPCVATTNLWLVALVAGVFRQVTWEQYIYVLYGLSFLEALVLSAWVLPVMARVLAGWDQGVSSEQPRRNGGPRAGAPPPS